MTDKMMEFLKKVSEDEALAQKVGAEADTKVIAAIAKELGFELTEADFAKEAEELSDDELDTVAGGTKVSCTCVLGGGGTKDHNDKTCACVAAGLGYRKNGEQRCFCAVGGAGYDY